MPSASYHGRDWESHANNAYTYIECKLGPTEAISFPGSMFFPEKGNKRDPGNEVATERGFQSGPFLWCQSQAKKSKRDFYFYTHQDETVYLRYT